MSDSTWTWISNNVNVDSSSDWELTSGPGNITGIPEAGDTVNNTGYPSGFGVIDASIRFPGRCLGQPSRFADCGDSSRLARRIGRPMK